MKAIKREMEIFKATEDIRRRVLLAVPLTGLIRAEWALARWGQIIPTNWSQGDVIQWIDQFSPMGFLVADARNVAVKHLLDGNFEWLLFIDHDVILPPNVFVMMNEYMRKRTIPIIGGLYFTKSVPSEPLMYRGRGNSFFTDWKLGDKVWVDAYGMGCTMIHRSIIEAVWKDSKEYVAGNAVIRQVFETPGKTSWDAEKNVWKTVGGTEDLVFFSRIKDRGYFAKAGWKKYQKMEWPLLCDTSIFCKHIDWNGTQYPANGEERQYLKKAK
jgi:hypothetical protein